MELNRRTFIVGAASTGITGLFTGAVGAKELFRFQPDAQVLIAGRNAPIDVALLGPNGEATAGFYASLDVFHGRPFEQMWNYIYQPLLGNGQLTNSTDETHINRVLTHIEGHGIPRDELVGVYERVRGVWNRRPDLRSNGPAPAAD